VCREPELGEQTLYQGRGLEVRLRPSFLFVLCKGSWFMLGLIPIRIND
jgi:hypothetical protein